jgi:hypothetical protein
VITTVQRLYSVTRLASTSSGSRTKPRKTRRVCPSRTSSPRKSPKICERHSNSSKRSRPTSRLPTKRAHRRTERAFARGGRGCESRCRRHPHSARAQSARSTPGAHFATLASPGPRARTRAGLPPPPVEVLDERTRRSRSRAWLCLCQSCARAHCRTMLAQRSA